MGARRNAASVEKLLLLHLVVQSFINHTNHILRLFAPLAILLLLWYFFFLSYLIENTILFHHFPLSIPPQAFLLMPA